MKILIIIIFLYFSLVHTSFGQDKSTCNCLENLHTTIAKTEANYAGYPDKIERYGQENYRHLVDSLETAAGQTNHPEDCFYLIAAYTRFFKDKHFQFLFFPGDNLDKTIVNISLESTKQQLKDSSPHSIQGIWQNLDTTLQLAIVKTGETNKYQGIVVESKKEDIPEGLVYFTLTPKNDKYIVKKYNSFSNQINISKQRNNLFHADQLWTRNYPFQPTPEEQEELTIWKNNRGLHFEKLNEDFAYLKIPTFVRNDEQIAALVAQNDATIQSTPYLIIDLRGNGGGSSGWIHLLPYLYTQPITPGMIHLRVSPDNVEGFIQDYQSFVEEPLPEALTKYMSDGGEDKFISQLKKAIAELPQYQGAFYPIEGPAFQLDKVTKYPEKVALIVDEFCGSSSEYFMYLGRQSTKTTSFGRNTSGVMDYQGPPRATKLPCSSYYLGIPVEKSEWTDTHPIDETGFAPDVVIHEPEDQWLNYVMKYLQEN